MRSPELAVFAEDDHGQIWTAAIFIFGDGYIMAYDTPTTYPSLNHIYHYIPISD